MNKKILNFEKNFKSKLGLVWLAIITLVTAIALRAHVLTIPQATAVAEPFEISIEDPLVSKIYPGESDVIRLRVKNNASTTLSALISETINITNPDPDGDGRRMELSDISVDYANNPDNVPGKGYTDFLITISVAPEAENGLFDINFNVERAGPIE